MLRTLLLCGLLAGLCGGLLATGFARVAGEPQVARAIAFESARSKAAGVPQEKPIVSRRLQSSLGLLTAAAVYGLSLGGLFALAFAAVYGRVGRASPARTSIWLAAAAFIVLYLVPFVKYPANPPSVGDPSTIGERTALYLTMILVSLLAAIAAVRLRSLLSERRTSATATLIAVFAYLVVVVLAGALLPSINEVPKDVPGSHALPLPRGVRRHAGRALGDDRPRLRRYGWARDDRAADPSAPQTRHARDARRAPRAPVTLSYLL